MPVKPAAPPRRALSSVLQDLNLDTSFSSVAEDPTRDSSPSRADMSSFKAMSSLLYALSSANGFPIRDAGLFSPPVPGTDSAGAALEVY